MHIDVFSFVEGREVCLPLVLVLVGKMYSRWGQLGIFERNAGRLDVYFRLMDREYFGGSCSYKTKRLRTGEWKCVVVMDGDVVTMKKCGSGDPALVINSVK